MNKIKLIFIFTGLFLFSGGQENAKNRFLYIGTFTSEGAEGVYLCSFNTESGDLNLVNTFKGFDNPSFLKISPDRKYLYVVTRPPKAVEGSLGYVSAFEINRDYSLRLLNKQLSHGEDPCHVDVSPDGKFVAVANYRDGTMATYRVGEGGHLSPATSIIRNEGKGINADRQAGPHAHSIKFSLKNNEVFSLDLGIDKVMRFELEKNEGILVKSGQPFLPLAPGSGPRHFEFHPTKDILYVINELSSTIVCFEKSGGRWSEFQMVSTLPADFKGASFCADIHISKDGKLLYGSNRGNNSIVSFSVNGNTGKLTMLGHTPTEGNWPRNFTLSPDGSYMLVGNQRTGNITVFRINQKTGMPEFTGKELKLPSPVCLEFY